MEKIATKDLGIRKFAAEYFRDQDEERIYFVADETFGFICGGSAKNCPTATTNINECVCRTEWVEFRKSFFKFGAT